MDVGAWLRELGLEEYAPAFEANGVDAALLPQLTNEDLKDLGVGRLSDRKRLLRAIAKLSDDNHRSEVGVPPAASFDGERRQVTVLFADLADFTGLSTDLDPEELRHLVTRFYEVSDRIIERYGGTVDKHLGDGVMALFGAPCAHDDDPVRAARAALDIHQAMSALSTELGGNLSLHAGIASGEVVAGGLGRNDHQEYTVLGDAVNLASRLDGLANPGETLIAEAVQRAVADHVECEPCGEVRLKGLNRPVRVWRAKGLLVSGVRRGPFVGRHSELRQFSSLLDSCKGDGTGQVILVRGEAGIGKTRLVEEVTKIGKEKGFVVHKGLVLNFGVGKGQDAVRSVVRSLLDVVGGSEVERAAAADAVFAAEWLEADQRVFLNDLLDLPQPSELRAIYDAMDNATRIRGKQRVLADLIMAVSRRRAALLVVEDVHWADPLTLGHLAEITAAVRDSPAVLVMTTRVEGDPLDSAWRSKAQGSSLVTIDLGPLRRDEAIELAGGLMDATQSTVLRCVERAEGNPLFLEQLLRNAEESEDEAVPRSIQSLVLARMDRLRAHDKEALQAASVIGQRFALDLLRHLLDDPHYACASLIDQWLIRPEGEAYLFAHALIQEGVYSTLLRKRARALHRRAAGWFSERDAALKAEHLDRAEDPAAPDAYLDAAKEYAERYHYERAKRLIERGLAIATAAVDKFALTCAQGQILHDLGSIDLSILAYGEALEMAQDDTGRCRVWLGLAAGMRITDRYDEALAVLDQAEAVARRHGLVRERAEIHHIRGNLYFPLGKIDGCLEQHELARKHARAASALEDEAHALGGLGDAYYMRGRMITAFDHFNRCVELCRKRGFGRIEVANLPMRGHSRLYKNELNGALEDGFAAAEVASKVSHHRAEIIARLVIQNTYECMGDWNGLEEQARGSLELVRHLGARRFEPQCLDQIGLVLATRGHVAEALEFVKEAMSICRETGAAFMGPWILGTLSMLSEDPTTRRKARVEAERILRSGAVSHCYLWFYRKAIEACLAHGDWNGVEWYAAALERYTRPEPLPWSDFFIARGRALAAFGRGSRDDATMQELRGLCEKGAEVGLNSAVPALAQALRQA